MVLFPPPFYFVFYISTRIVHTLISSYELAPPIMGTIFLVFIAYWASEASPTLGCSIEISRDIILEKWFPLWGERAHSLKLFCMYDKRFEISKTK